MAQKLLLQTSNLIDSSTKKFSTQFILMKKRYIIIFLILIFAPLSALASFSDKPLATIAFEQKTFKECLSELNQIFDVEITLTGDLKNVSNDKLNITMEQVSLEQAVKELVRKAGIQSHALVLGGESNHVRVWVLKAGEKEFSNKKAYKTFVDNDESPLTPEQMYLLAQQSQRFDESDEKPLTQEQQKKLEEQSAKIEAKIDDAIKPLDSEQKEHLQKESMYLKAKMEANAQPLSNEQMEQLRAQDIQTAAKRENDIKPLSREQMLLLQNIEKKE